MKCLVTGATGFIGSRLVPHLESCGHEVVALSLRGETLPTGQTTAAIDLSTGIPEHHFEGVEVVLHLAGIAHQRATAADYQRINVEGTRKLALAAAEAGAKCFIYLSSVKAMGAASSERRRQESDTTSVLSDYGESKRAAEEALFNLSEEGAMSIIVLRPTLVYGAGAKGNLARLAKAASLNLPCPPDCGSRSMVSLSAFLELFQRLISEPLQQPFQCWIVCDDHGYSTAELYKALLKTRGRAKVASWVPLPLVKVACTAADLLLRSDPEPLFSKVFGTELYANDSIKEGTRWQPVNRIEEWAQAVAKQEGWTE